MVVDVLCQAEHDGGHCQFHDAFVATHVDGLVVWKIFGKYLDGCCWSWGGIYSGSAQEKKLDDCGCSQEGIYSGSVRGKKYLVSWSEETDALL